MNIETQETITFDEFRAWLAGLIRGKNGALPDLNDWKIIKQMIDKVKVEQPVTLPPVFPYPIDDPPCRPPNPWPEIIPQSPPRWVPNTGDPFPSYNPVWCSDGVDQRALDNIEWYALDSNVTTALNEAFGTMLSTENKEA